MQRLQFGKKYQFCKKWLIWSQSFNINNLQHFANIAKLEFSVLKVVTAMPAIYFAFHKSNLPYNRLELFSSRRYSCIIGPVPNRLRSACLWTLNNVCLQSNGLCQTGPMMQSHLCLLENHGTLTEGESSVRLTSSLR